MVINFWTVLLALAAMWCIVEISKNICYTILLSRVTKYTKGNLDKAADTIDNLFNNLDDKKSKKK